MEDSIEHWTVPTCVGYIKESSLTLNTFKPYLFEEFAIPIKTSMNNKHKSKKISCKMTKKRPRTRNKLELISEIKRLAELDRNFLNYSYLRKNKRNDLLVDAVKNFGGWRKAVQAASYRPIQKGWTKEEIKKELSRLSLDIGKTPTRADLRKLQRNDLERAATRYFGSWNKGLIATGLKCNKRTDLTKKKSISELKKFSKKIGHTPSMRELIENNQSDLLRAGLKHFGKYNIFLKNAGLKVVLDMNKWPKSKIISQLQQIHSSIGRTPRRNELAAMKRYDLINAAETYFPTWSDALVAAGLVPNADVLHDDKTWREWENLIFEYFSNQNIDYKKKKYIKRVGYPDIYIPAQQKIVEIKINCSDTSVKKDIQKYLPHCKTLEIWYLYGKPFGILSNKVKFIGPNQIKNKLSAHENLSDRFKKIKNRRKTHVTHDIKKALVLGSGAN